MPTIIVQADIPNRRNRHGVTLTERLLASHLQTDHYIAQLIERLGWAVIDAEELEVALAAGTRHLP